jgi:hypothetical protein
LPRTSQIESFLIGRGLSRGVAQNLDVDRSAWGMRYHHLVGRGAGDTTVGA